MPSMMDKRDFGLHDCASVVMRWCSESLKVVARFLLLIFAQGFTSPDAVNDRFCRMSPRKLGLKFLDSDIRIVSQWDFHGPCWFDPLKRSMKNKQILDVNVRWHLQMMMGSDKKECSLRL